MHGRRPIENVEIMATQEAAGPNQGYGAAFGNAARSVDDATEMPGRQVWRQRGIKGVQVAAACRGAARFTKRARLIDPTPNG
jgi:hypothetical protein